MITNSGFFCRAFRHSVIQLSKLTTDGVLFVHFYCTSFKKSRSLQLRLIHWSVERKTELVDIPGTDIHHADPFHPSKLFGFDWLWGSSGGSLCSSWTLTVLASLGSPGEEDCAVLTQHQTVLALVTNSCLHNAVWQHWKKCGKWLYLIVMKSDWESRKVAQSRLLNHNSNTFLISKMRLS